ncbi:PTS system mannose/fructose/N-acetylgalactosamine-transporter subunit IIB [Dielma fastidiosa]|uniref:PTS system mannose/fructose/N-acetylgalactosamine-transporter subunit IIB n=1 Tax=Dielma fastidiosa TaxID=1034346 RepID=UPI003564F72F
MIEMLRLDERLIHGQVATQWLRALSVDSVIVVDDNSANNKMLRNALMLATPSNLKTVVKTCEEAIAILTDKRCVNRKVFVVTGKVSYLKQITDACNDIKLLVVGNYGSINAEKVKREKRAPTVYLTEEERSVLAGICEYDYPCYYWEVPAKDKIDLSKIL